MVIALKFAILFIDVGDQVKLVIGERDWFLVLDYFLVFAEIWQHTDSNHPSDENDIVRLDDDYGR